MMIWQTHRWTTRIWGSAVATLILALAIGGALLNQPHVETHLLRERLLVEKGEIERLDELLSMSARMYAATGEESWRSRYLSATPKLDNALREAKSLAAELSGEAGLIQTDTANSVLLKLEAQALEKAAAGQLAAATAILDSTEYQAEKTRYAEGIQQLWITIWQTAEENASRSKQILWTVLFLAVLAICALLISMWAMANKVWLYDRRQEIVKQAAGKPSGHSAFIPAVTLFLFGLVLTCGVCWVLVSQTEANAKIRYDRLQERLETEINRRFNQIVNGLKSVRGLYLTQPDLTTQQFRQYVNSLDLEMDFPGVMGFGFIDLVKRDELQRYIDQKRASGSPDFDVRTSGNLPDLYIVSDVEPLQSNKSAVGYDLGSETVRRNGLIRAIESNTAVISGKVTLVQDGSSRAGFLFYLPVYEYSAMPAQPDGRARLLGLVYAPLILDEVLERINEVTLDQVDFELFDGESTTPDKMIYDDDHHLLHSQELGYTPFRRFHSKEQIMVGGRTWTLSTSSKFAFESSVDFTAAKILGGGGFLLSGVLGLLIFILNRQRGQALEAANAITVDLSAAKLAADQARAEAELLLRDNRTLHDALDRHSIISTADRSGRIQSANAAFCRISGYSRNELLGQDHRILNSGVHPREFWVDMWRTLTAGNAWHGLVCNKSKTGELYWVDTTIVPYQDETGKIEKYISIRFDVTQLKLTQQILNESRQQLDLIIQSTGAGIWDWQVQTGVVQFNERWAEIIGYSLQELEPISIETWSRLAHPDDLQVSNQRLQAHWRGETDRYTQECRIRHKEGHWIWVLDTGSVVEWSEDRKPLRMVGTHLDITPQKSAENAIRLSEERYRQLADSLNDVIFTADARTARPTYVNKAIEKVWGYSIEEWLSNPSAFVDSLHPEDKENVITSVKQHLEAGVEHFTVEYRIITKLGGIRWIHAAISIIANEAGQPERFTGLCSDITGQKLAAEKLARQQSMLEQMSRQARIGAWEIDAASQKLFWSSMTKIIHEVEDDFIPNIENAIEFYKEGEHRAIIDKLFRSALQQGTPFSVELQIVTAKGREIWVATTGHAQMKNGVCTRLIGSLQDIDARKRVERELNQAKEAAEAAARAKSDFLATMSHEIRTPMNGVIGMLALVQKSAMPPDQQRKIAIAKSSADSLLSLINDILDFSKVEAGKLEFEQIDFDLTGLLHETCEVMALRAEEKNVRLLLDASAMQWPHVKGDPGRVRQILNNLLGNAIKFTERGEIRVHCALQEHEAYLQFNARVIDTGIGIPADKIGHLFNSFTQVDASTTRKYGGSGLGLAITRRLCELMGGHISVQSTLGTGSEFAFSIRLKRGEAPAQPKLELTQGTGTVESAPIDWPENTNILLVEDNPVNQEVAQLLLSDFGLSCEVAPNGFDALKLLAEKPADHFVLILMDCQMPGMDGYEATRAIRSGKAGEQQALLPIIAMTANALKEDKERCIDAGMNDYLSKPIDASQFLALLKQWLLPPSAVRPFKEAVPIVPATLVIEADALPLWDETAALEIVKQKKDRLRMLLTMFCVSTPEMLATLQKAVVDENFEQIELIAHTLKGSVGQLKGIRTAQLAAQLNNACKAKNLDAIRSITPTLVSACTQLLMRFESYLAEYGN